MLKTVPFQIIQITMSTQFKCKYDLIVKNISISSYSVYSYNSVQRKYFVRSILPIDRALSGATTPGQSGPGSNGNEGVLCILPESSITGTSPSDCLVSYRGHSWGGRLTRRQMCSRCILPPQTTGQFSLQTLVS